MNLSLDQNCFSVFNVLIFFAFLTQAQYVADFSEVGKGVSYINSTCSGTDPTVWEGYCPGSNWTMSGTAGDAFNLGTNLSGGVTLFDYVRVVTPGSIETEDPDGDVCIDWYFRSGNCHDYDKSRAGWGMILMNSA